MIKTIIFDIGGVLIGYDWKAYMMKLFHGDEKLVDTLLANIFKDKRWDEVDRGVLTEDELIDSFSQDVPELRSEIKLFWDTCGDALWQYDFTHEWIDDLKARGYQLLFLSNWSDQIYRLAAKQLDFLPKLDGGVFSYKVKLIKPDHAIYNTLIERYDLNPSECVFLDDKIENIEAARECGLNAIQVTTHEEAVSQLEKILNC